MIVYLDTSALVKLCVDEEGSPAVASCVERGSDSRSKDSELYAGRRYLTAPTVKPAMNRSRKKL